MLGLMTCPSGSKMATLQQMQTQGQEWVDQVKNGKLSWCNAWFMLDRKFLPRLGIGICNNTASWDDLEYCLKRCTGNSCPREEYRAQLQCPPTIRQRILQDWLPSPQSRMLSCPNKQASCSLRMHIRTRYSNANVNGITDHQIGHLSPTTPGILCQIWEMDHPLLVEVDMGEGGQIQRNHRDCNHAYRSTSGRRQVVHAGCNGSRGHQSD
jgi:hypothetical protein